jgi:ribosomal protein S18 acetylase RimI-like enzyme
MNNSAAIGRDETLLDNPIWSSLNSGHTHLAIGVGRGSGLARRYPADIGPLSGFREPSQNAYADLGAIVPEGEVAVLFLDEPVEVPAGWELMRDGTLAQMICRSVPSAPAIDDQILPLGTGDFAEMLELTKLTEPGPFRERTGELGGFLGIRVDGRLAAMAGRRLAPMGFAEVSAVCTHPDFRGRGYALALVAAVARSIYGDGRVPFLTSFEANTGAIRVYEQAGFELRRRFELAVLKPPPSKQT